jgi:hypothetical protein
VAIETEKLSRHWKYLSVDGTSLPHEMAEKDVVDIPVDELLVLYERDCPDAPEVLQENIPHVGVSPSTT